MEMLVAKPKQAPVSERHRRNCALASGARSAFDMSGLVTLSDPVLAVRRPKGESPAEAIGRDMARITERLGRSATCALLALRKGLRIEDMERGCTADPRIGPAAFGRPYPRRASQKSID
jgi:hypothetical protein